MGKNAQDFTEKATLSLRDGRPGWGLISAELWAYIENDVRDSAISLLPADSGLEIDKEWLEEAVERTEWGGAQSRIDDLIYEWLDMNWGNVMDNKKSMIENALEYWEDEIEEESGLPFSIWKEATDDQGMLEIMLARLTNSGQLMRLTTEYLRQRGMAGSIYGEWPMAIVDGALANGYERGKLIKALKRIQRSDIGEDLAELWDVATVEIDYEALINSATHDVLIDLGGEIDMLNIWADENDEIRLDEGTISEFCLEWGLSFVGLLEAQYSKPEWRFIEIDGERVDMTSWTEGRLAAAWQESHYREAGYQHQPQISYETAAELLAKMASVGEYYSLKMRISFADFLKLDAQMGERGACGGLMLPEGATLSYIPEETWLGYSDDPLPFRLIGEKSMEGARTALLEEGEMPEWARYEGEIGII